MITTTITIALLFILVLGGLKIGTYYFCVYRKLKKYEIEHKKRIETILTQGLENAAVGCEYEKLQKIN